MSSRTAWAVRLATASPMYIFVPFRHCAQKWKKLLESHLSLTCEGRADGRWYGDEGKVMHNEGCSFHQMSCQLPSNNATHSWKNTVEQSRDRWHHRSIVRVRFGELWIFMMLIYWVAIGARTANKLSPPCLKGNALPILKTLSCSLKLRLQVGNASSLFNPAWLLAPRRRKNKTKKQNRLPVCHSHDQTDPLRNLRT